MPIFQRNGRLEEAMSTLLQNQAALVQNQAAFLARASATDQRLSELERINAERFSRIEALLLRHEQLLQALPEAIREKIGFKAPGT
jgi:hypothetical protein